MYVCDGFGVTQDDTPVAHLSGHLEHVTIFFCPTLIERCAVL